MIFEGTTPINDTHQCYGFVYASEAALLYALGHKTTIATTMMLEATAMKKQRGLSRRGFIQTGMAG
ncbi:MAG: hypothetical protein ABSH28_24335, partial [Acidobacteriota bacterium]